MAERPPLLKRTARNQIPTRAGGYSIHEFHSFPESRFLEHEPGHRNSEPASTKKRSLLWPASPSGIRSTGLQPLLLLFVAFLLFFLFSVTLMLRLLLLVLLLRLRLPLDARVLLLWLRLLRGAVVLARASRPGVAVVAVVRASQQAAAFQGAAL